MPEAERDAARAVAAAKLAAVVRCLTVQQHEPPVLTVDVCSSDLAGC